MVQMKRTEIKTGPTFISRVLLSDTIDEQKVIVFAKTQIRVFKLASVLFWELLFTDLHSRRDANEAVAMFWSLM
jgi:hypothetical protein